MPEANAVALKSVASAQFACIIGGNDGGGMIIGEGRSVTIAVVFTAVVLFLLFVVMLVLGFERYGPRLSADLGGQANVDGKTPPVERQIGESERTRPDNVFSTGPTMRMKRSAPAGRRVRPPDRALADAKPVPEGSPAAWFKDIYPPGEMLAEGRVVAALKIDATGFPIECAIITSSRSPGLDEMTCSGLLDDATFTPARDRNGVATIGDYTVPVRWVLSEN